MTKTNRKSIRVHYWLPLVALGYAAACASTGQQNKAGQVPSNGLRIHHGYFKVRKILRSHFSGTHCPNDFGGWGYHDYLFPILKSLFKNRVVKSRRWRSSLG